MTVSKLGNILFLAAIAGAAGVLIYTTITPEGIEEKWVQPYRHPDAPPLARGRRYQVSSEPNAANISPETDWNSWPHDYFHRLKLNRDPDMLECPPGFVQVGETEDYIECERE
jgi:hypothetical protein